MNLPALPSVIPRFKRQVGPPDAGSHIGHAKLDVSMLYDGARAPNTDRPPLERRASSRRCKVTLMAGLVSDSRREWASQGCVTQEAHS